MTALKCLTYIKPIQYNFWGQTKICKRKWNTISIQMGFLVFYVVSNNSIDHADIILLGQNVNQITITEKSHHYHLSRPNFCGVYVPDPLCFLLLPKLPWQTCRTGRCFVCLICTQMLKLKKKKKKGWKHSLCIDLEQMSMQGGQLKKHIKKKKKTLSS